MLSFGDESADDTKRRTFAVAALLGSDEDWRAVESDWTGRTGELVFHAADCEADKGDFDPAKGRTHEENQRLYSDLTQILAKSAIVGFGAAMDVQAFDEIFHSRSANQPYFMCFERAIWHCAEWIAKNAPNERIEFTFDRNRDVEFNAHYLYDGLRHLREWDGRIYLASKFSTDTRENPRIQMADLFARETMKELERRRDGVRDKRQSMLALEKCGRFNFDFDERQDFIDLDRALSTELKNLSAGHGGDFIAGYREWITEMNMQDNETNKIWYMHNLHGIGSVKPGKGRD